MMIAIDPIERLAEDKELRRDPHKPRFDVGLAVAAVIVAACGLFVVAMTRRMVVLSWEPGALLGPMGQSCEWDTAHLGIARSATP